MADVFISYGRPDAATAELIAQTLRASGYTVWRDDALRSGEAFDEKIEQALRTARAVVVLWSKASVASRWVRAEATVADRNKTIVPVMIEPCERPIIFELLQTLDLSGWQGATDDRTWQALLADIHRLVRQGGTPAGPAAATPGAAPAAAATVRAAPAEPVVAVLPFDNLSSDAEMQFFSDGVSEEIIQRLARGAQLKVIGRTSSFQFRGDRKGEAAGALKCSHVLDGSVRRAADRVRIAAHLVQTAAQTTLWSERYDRGLDDVFAVQDEIAEAIAAALQHTFTSFSTQAIDPAAYDLYLRASPRSFAPDELRSQVGLLEQATQQAPRFAEAWGRLAYLRAWLRLYQPFTERHASGQLVTLAAERALALDPRNIDALLGQFLAIAPFGRFIESEAVIERIRQADSPGGEMYVSRYLRSTGRVREGCMAAEHAYPLNALDSLFANLFAIAIMATGRVRESVPILENLVTRLPDSSFPVANLMRAYAFLGDWAAVDRLLDPAAGRPLREFEEGLMFIRTKRDPTPANVGAMRDALEARVKKTGCVDVARLVYAAHVGLVEEAYQAIEGAHLGPRGTADDIMGPDGYATGMLFWHGMPEIRQDRRFVKLCARLGLGELWLASGKWPDCADEAPYDFRAECEKYRGFAKDPFF